jgi:hypothetical protein
MLLYSQTLITTLHDPHRENSLYCWQGICTASLHSNECPIVACTCLEGMCLQTRCLAMGMHIKIWKLHSPCIVPVLYYERKNGQRN